MCVFCSFNSFQILCISYSKDNSIVKVDVAHRFVVHSYNKLIWCDHCGAIMFGLRKQGLKCEGESICYIKLKYLRTSEEMDGTLKIDQVRGDSKSYHPPLGCDLGFNRPTYMVILHIFCNFKKRSVHILGSPWLKVSFTILHRPLLYSI